MGVSIRPDNMTGGGGLPNDLDITVKKSRVEVFTYPGIMKKTTRLKWEMTDSGGEEIEEGWSIGDPALWRPSKDGKTIEIAGQASVLPKSSNFKILSDSLMEAGFPIEKLDDDVSVYEGLEAHVIRIPQPDRVGLKGGSARKRADGTEYEKTVLIVDKIHKLPWEDKESDKAESSDTEKDAENQAREIAMELLYEHGSLKKAQLIAKSFAAGRKAGLDKTTLNAVSRILNTDAFLKARADEGFWNYENGTLSKLE